MNGTFKVFHAEFIRIITEFHNLTNQFPEQVFRLDDISQMVKRPFLYNRSEIFICKGFLVCNPIVFQKFLHIQFGTLREIPIEDNSQNIILKFTGIHLSPQFICNRPQLLRQFVRLRLIFIFLCHRSYSPSALYF